MSLRKRASEFTYDDYLTLPAGKRYEVIDGELFMVPSPTTRHQRIALRLANAFSDFVAEKGLGEVFAAPLDVKLSPSDIVQPDIFFVSRNRSERVQEYIEGAPDLVVEIFSLESRQRDSFAKRKLYFRYGVREYWLVDPESLSIEVLRAGENDFIQVGTYAESESIHSEIMPELVIPLTSLFRA